MSNIVGAVNEAQSHLQPAHLKYSAGEGNVGINRREKMPDGHMEIGRNPEGARDKSLQVLAVITEAGERLATLNNYACHGTVLGPDNLLVSADWIGVMRYSVEEKLGGLTLFLQGAAANINPDMYWEDAQVYEKVIEQGLGVAHAVVAVTNSGVEKVCALPPVAPLQGSLSLGYKFFDILDPFLIDGQGFVGKIDISAGLFKRTIGRASFSQDYDFSAYSGSTYHVSTTFGGGISRRLSRRSTFSYDLSFNKSDYPAPQDGGTPSGQNYFNTNHNLSLGLQLSRNLNITFIALFSERTVEEAGLATNRNFFGINLFYGFAAGSITAPVPGLSR